jgi:hypothetical protein
MSFRQASPFLDAEGFTRNAPTEGMLLNFVRTIGLKATEETLEVRAAHWFGGYLAIQVELDFVAQRE